MKNHSLPKNATDTMQAEEREEKQSQGHYLSSKTSQILDLSFTCTSKFTFLFKLVLCSVFCLLQPEES